MNDIDRESDVGIGVVYEQFRLNLLLGRIVKKYNAKTVLESPIYGMAGLTGINSMVLPEPGVKVTLADCPEHINIAEKAWQRAKRNIDMVQLDGDILPFKNNQFDLAYNFAALWHLDNPEKRIVEMCRVSNLVLICMPNPWNPCFQIRKLFGFLPKQKIWANERKISECLVANGFKIVETGLLDIPPWPDLVVSLKSIIPDSKKSKSWRWSMLDYYSGNSDMKNKIKKLYFIEDSCLPGFIKKLWAHHFYVVATKKVSQKL